MKYDVFLIINEQGLLKIFKTKNEDKVTLKKKRHLLECMRTGEISLQNRLYSGEIESNTEGAEKLYKQIKK
ncbi:hypothetical protein KX843_26125 [Priestia megaterium]|nr:hypothetical protein [Priestia megaterium]